MFLTTTVFCGVVPQTPRNSLKTSPIFLLKSFWNAKSNQKFGQRGVVLVIPMPGKRFWNAVPGCLILRKSFWNGVLACSITKIPLPITFPFIYFTKPHTPKQTQHSRDKTINQLLFVLMSEYACFKK
jgi:hypothetical protein